MASQQQERELTICILEKGSEVGAHILSGAVLEPRSLNELIPDWKDKGAPLSVAVKSDRFQYLTKTRAISMPTSKFIASLSTIFLDIKP